MALRRLLELWRKVSCAKERKKIVGGQPLTYGQSITDPCLGWEDTERLVEKLASAVDTRF